MSCLVHFEPLKHGFKWGHIKAFSHSKHITIENDAREISNYCKVEHPLKHTQVGVRENVGFQAPLAIKIPTVEGLAFTNRTRGSQPNAPFDSVNIVEDIDMADQFEDPINHD
ncbi:hypothetical protein QJS10_CPA16g00663 [Acorus calamus]|uniref:Uncharacterized protein n=1 Tax=Acorus calamus TaxID=4465 RepID=A0AAV9D394_ACOCL|nr:hypothetical protein QJS10_CPA16g00663 [Acorus calamus]